jgi:protein-disulfide isomerase
MSGQRDREIRLDEAQGEDQAEVAERRQKLIRLASAVAFLAVIAVAVLIVVSQSQSNGGDSENIEGAAAVKQELAGIPQKRLVLGEPNAPVSVLEFGDLQCPVCKGYAEDVLPQVIENQVRSGAAKLDFRNFPILGSESTTAAAAAIAAGEQGRGWNFIKLFYRNQGSENSGYVTDEFLTAVARAVGMPDIVRWNSERQSKAVLAEVEETTNEAQSLGFTGTPSFALEASGTKGPEALGTPSSADALEAAISQAN